MNTSLKDYCGGEVMQKVLDEVRADGITAEWQDMAGGYVWVYAYREDGSCVVFYNAFATDNDSMDVAEFLPEHDPLVDCWEPDAVHSVDPDSDSPELLFIRVFRNE